MHEKKAKYTAKQNILTVWKRKGAIDYDLLKLSQTITALNTQSDQNPCYSIMTTLNLIYCSTGKKLFENQ